MDQQLSQHLGCALRKRHWMEAGEPTLIKMESVSHRDQKATHVLLLVIRSRCGPSINHFTLSDCQWGDFCMECREDEGLMCGRGNLTLIKS